MEGLGAHYAVVLHRPELQRTGTLVRARQRAICLPRLGWPLRISSGRASGRMALAEIGFGLVESPIFRRGPAWLS